MRTLSSVLGPPVGFFPFCAAAFSVWPSEWRYWFVLYTRAEERCLVCPPLAAVGVGLRFARVVVAVAGGDALLMCVSLPGSHRLEGVPERIRRCGRASRKESKKW